MKNFTRVCILFFLFLFSFAAHTQSLQPFEGCPGQALAITRPGFNSTDAAYQVYNIDESGNIQAIGAPIHLQINGFGLNTVDGFLYGMHESANAANPFLTRVDKNGAFVNLGLLVAPQAPLFHMGVINTAAGTIDGKDNYYFTAAVFNLQNTAAAPKIYVGKVEKLSTLAPGSGMIPITYTEINPGTCAADLLRLLNNPNDGAFQDIAYNEGNDNIYTYLPASSSNQPATIVYFNPADNAPALTCLELQPGIVTKALAGLYFGNNSTLHILTIDGKYYKANVNSGNIDFVKQTTLPLFAGNLRGDMAFCSKPPKRVLRSFSGCPGISVAITRPGNNNGTQPYQIYKVTEATGEMETSGAPIPLQINAFGLNGTDGFMYALHESGDVVHPWFTRVDSEGDYEDIGTLSGPAAGANEIGIINTAAATTDTSDNYYFTAVTINPANPVATVKFYLGKIANISSLQPGDNVPVDYTPVGIDDCASEILTTISNAQNGILQDIAYSSADGRIYTYFPAAGKIAYLVPGANPALTCLTPSVPNEIIKDLAGLFIGPNRHLYILTTDGKYYQADTQTGQVILVTQTSLPLENGNLRGDMASCQKPRKPVALTPFTGCPGTAVAITKPGFNSAQHPYHIYEIATSTGVTTPTGSPIPLQINAFGLNKADGLMYALHETDNVLRPSFTRVDKNGNYEDINTITPPANEGTRIGIIGTNAATIDGSDNYYFPAILANPNNPLEKPSVYIGKITNISALHPGDPITVTYIKINAGTCLDEALGSVTSLGSGVGQDIAFNPADGRLYTYFSGLGKIAYFDLGGTPELKCITPTTPNPATQDLAGLFIGPKGALYILTTDGKYYKGDVTTGNVTLVGQTNLPLESGTLRGDMASCPEAVGTTQLRPFTGCPGISVAITRPGFNDTKAPYQVYTVTETTGSMQPAGDPINLQINAFGLNSKDGLLYALHESADITQPWFTRLGRDGNHEDISRLSPPPVASAAESAIINTAGGTMDGNDNYYLTAFSADPQQVSLTAKLYIGVIRNVSLLKAGDPVTVEYKQLRFGSCLGDLIAIISGNTNNGILQDIAFDAATGRMYTYFPQTGKLAFFYPSLAEPMMFCLNNAPTNTPAKDLAGLYFGKDGLLYILTVDGNYYTGKTTTGEVTLVTKTTLPLLNGNLRGDMASCVPPTTITNPIYPRSPFIWAYPNPIKNNLLLVKIQAPKASLGSDIQITDSKGFIMLRKKADFTEGINQLMIDIGRLPKGIYILSATDVQRNKTYTKFLRE